MLKKTEITLKQKLTDLGKICILLFKRELGNTYSALNLFSTSN